MTDERLSGYIREYANSTLMECSINTNIDYNNLDNLLK
jgi:hypothetical protein